MHSISSGAPFGEEQPDEVGLQLLPRDEVHAKALLQRQPDQIGEMTMTMMMVIYMTTIMMMEVKFPNPLVRRGPCLDDGGDDGGDDHDDDDGSCSTSPTTRSDR